MKSPISSRPSAVDCEMAGYRGQAAVASRTAVARCRSDR